MSDLEERHINYGLGYKSKYEVMEELGDECLALMEDLYQSGFDTVHDTTLKELEKTAALTKQYGMEYLAGLLTELFREISAGRHQMKTQTARLAELYTQINEYIYLCSQKTAYDRGLDYYSSSLAD